LWSYLGHLFPANQAGKAEIAAKIKRSAYHLRPAAQADQSTIKAIIRANRLNPLGLKWSQFILAETADHQIIGCGQVKPHRDGSRELASIAVIPPWRNQGIATAIINRLLTAHTPPLWLTCESRLVPFYEKFGFVQLSDPARMPPYFRRLAHLSRLWQRLAPGQTYLAVMMWAGQTPRGV
jgi:N-acetylglutamate synthase-like GNAT family acetyltransferase